MLCRIDFIGKMERYGNKMKVLFINYSYGSGSTGRLIYDLIKENSNNEFEFCVACKKSSIKKENIYIIGNKISNLYAGLMSRITGLQGYNCLLQTFRLVQFIKEYNPDVIHLNTIHGNYLNMGILFKYLKSFKGNIIWTLHDCWAFTGNCGFFNLETDCLKWQKEYCIGCERKKEYPPSWIFNRSHKMIMDKLKFYAKELDNLQFVSVSKWMYNCAELSIIKKHKNCIIYNWVDLNKFCVKRQKNNKKIKLIAIASKWSELKGIKKINDFVENSRLEFELYIIGYVEKKYIIKNNSRIKYVGTVNDISSLVDYYNQVDICLSLSLAESFGMTIAEAMACGTPSIVLKKSASSEFIDNTGVVIDDYSVENLEAAILKIANNKDTYSQELCRAKAEKLFGKDNIKNYMKIYAGEL